MRKIGLMAAIALAVLAASAGMVVLNGIVQSTPAAAMPMLAGTMLLSMGLFGATAASVSYIYGKDVKYQEDVTRRERTAQEARRVAQEQEALSLKLTLAQYRREQFLRRIARARGIGRISWMRCEALYRKTDSYEGPVPLSNIALVSIDEQTPGHVVLELPHDPDAAAELRLLLLKKPSWLRIEEPQPEPAKA